MTCDVLLLDDDDLDFLDDASRLIEVPPEAAELLEEFKLAISGEERIEIGRKLSRLLRRLDFNELWDLLETGKILGQLSTVVRQINVTKDSRITQNIQGQQVIVAAATDGSTATVSHASQQFAPAEFSGKALRAEVDELFKLVVGRIDALEEKHQPAVMEAITALKAVKFDGVTSEEDARQMLEDLWTDKMKSRYSALGKIVDAIGTYAGPRVVKFITSLVSGSS